MKKIFALLLAAALCLGLAACAAGDPAGPKGPDAGPSAPAAPAGPAPVSQPVPEDLPDPEPVWTVTEGVTFSLLQETYPAGTARLTLVIDNQSGLKVEWGTWGYYEEYVDGRWRKLDYAEDVVSTDEAFFLRPGSVRAQTLHDLDLLPALDEGLYRATGSPVRIGGEGYPAWQVSFRISADAKPEPDYALYIASQPIPTVDGCLATDRIPVKFINTTGEDGCVLHIPHLEKRNEAGEWETIPYREGIGFCGTPDPLPAEGGEWSEEISMLWGTLDDGAYRLSYEVGATFETETIAYGTFTLYTPENHGLPLAGSQLEE